VEKPLDWQIRFRQHRESKLPSRREVARETV
jgi:hypothetical protein